jgi:hypothetical protein
VCSLYVRPRDILISRGKKREREQEKKSPTKIEYREEKTKQRCSIRKLVTAGIITVTSSLHNQNKVPQNVKNLSRS